MRYCGFSWRKFDPLDGVGNAAGVHQVALEPRGRKTVHGNDDPGGPCLPRPQYCAKQNGKRANMRKRQPEPGVPLRVIGKNDSYVAVSGRQPLTRLSSDDATLADFDKDEEPEYSDYCPEDGPKTPGERNCQTGSTGKAEQSCNQHVPSFIKTDISRRQRTHGIDQLSHCFG